MTDRPEKARSRWLAVALLMALGCGTGKQAESVAPAEAGPLADHEGAVCGMLVRTQSAPRGQVVHRDGTNLFFCSIGDLLVHLSAPSPHGRVVEVFVEVLEPDEDPNRPHLAPHPWLRADEVAFVIGIERPNIMGEPVLAYRDAEAASQVTARNAGAIVLGFDELKLWWSERVVGS